MPRLKSLPMEKLACTTSASNIYLDVLTTTSTVTATSKNNIFSRGTKLDSIGILIYSFLIVKTIFLVNF